MTRARGISLCLVAAWMAPAVVLAGAESAPVTQEPAPAGAARSGIDGKLVATVGKSLIIDSPLKIEKISVANGDLVEAVAINPQEVLINGKLPGETSLIVWQQGGRRLVYDLTVRISPLKLEGVRQQISRDFPNENINVSYDNNTVFVRGTVPDMLSANRVLEIASTLGKPMNL
ncbi:MAG: pilus assembly protein N-terminal domain-containing protein, partial [Bryobacteraceae bacterium]